MNVLARWSSNSGCDGGSLRIGPLLKSSGLSVDDLCAVLNELADTDVADGYSVLMRIPADRGDREQIAAAALPPLDGIWIGPETS